MPEMSMMMSMATEGGRKCPQCCRYAKQTELGFLGGPILEAVAFAVETREPSHWRRIGFMDGYGHLPGFGCNRERATDA